MIRYTDKTTMPFGKYIGKLLKDVPASYLLKLKTEHGGLKEYISNNRAALEDREKAEKYASI